MLALESGSAARCHRLLRIALALGRKEGYVSIPFLTPQMLPRLCAEALDVGIELDYVRYIIRKRDLKPPLDAALSEHWPWPVKITTFGGLTLRIDDEPVRWPRKAQHKPIDLLRALVAYGGRGVPSCRLIDELWPEAEGDAATRSLKTTLHRLRKLLGREDAVQLRDGQISLNPTCVWVDRWAFEQVLEEMETPPFRTRLTNPTPYWGGRASGCSTSTKGGSWRKATCPARQRRARRCTESIFAPSSGLRGLLRRGAWRSKPEVSMNVPWTWTRPPNGSIRKSGPATKTARRRETMAAA